MMLWVISSGISSAEDFLGAPVMPGGKAVTQTDQSLKKAYDVSYEAALEYYRKALKDEKDIKFLDRGTDTHIEDHGARPWHSIAIVKVGEGKTEVVTKKDNWTWILGTLTLRFFGVFAVLIVLYIVLEISGAIISRVVKTKA
jgi:hypothetical protein